MGLLTVNLDFTALIAYLYIFEIIFFLLLLSYSWYHIILLLIVLEMMILAIFSCISLLVCMCRLSSILLFMFITLRVAEASVGVSLLTILVRRNGNDFVNINIF